jgi:hypothetical protein
MCAKNKFEWTFVEELGQPESGTSQVHKKHFETIFDVSCRKGS